MSRREIVDSQIHIWGANTAERPWPANAWDGKPAHPQREEPLGAEETLRLMDEAGVSRAVLVPPSWEGDRNDLALAAAQRWPDRFAVMGRIPLDAPPSVLKGWRDQPGMLGIRLIFAPDGPYAVQGAAHPIWRAVADAGIPVMLAPVQSMDAVTEIVDAFPSVRFALDHMGTGFIRGGEDEFADQPKVLALASRPNAAVKLSAVPCHSRRPSRPWDDVEPHLKRLFEAYGPARCFWGSDLSRLPCPYKELVDYFEQDLTWLRGGDLDLVMGAAIRAWLGWR